MLHEAQEPREIYLRELLTIPGGQISSGEQPDQRILAGLDHHGAQDALVHGPVHGHVQVLYGNPGRLQHSQRIRLPLQHGVGALGAERSLPLDGLAQSQRMVQVLTVSRVGR